MTTTKPYFSVILKEKKMKTGVLIFTVLLSGSFLLGAEQGAAKEGWESIYLKNDLIELQAVPLIGGRILQYKLGDYGFFYVNNDLYNKPIPASRLGPAGEWLNYGGDKLWPAPQGRGENEWPGPPDPVLDGGPFTPEITMEGNKPKAVRMTSEEDKQSGVQFSRKFQIFEDTTHVHVDATMKNIDTKPCRWGVWAVTQFNTSNRHGDGFNKNFWTYCPINPKSMYHRGYNVMLGLVGHLSYKPDYKNGMMRIQYDHRVGKIGMDSSAGWIAALDATDGYAFAHRFKYEPDKPYPDDASVEFWLNGKGELVAWGSEVIKMPDSVKDTPYLMETEVLSPYATVAPGESYTFSYDWYAAKVPVGCEIVTCNEVGITCKKLSAKVREGKLALDGDFGVFYKGTCRPVFKNAAESSIVSKPIPVTPLKALVLSEIPQLADIEVPEKATKITLEIYDAKDKLLGELAEAEIVRE
jgi:hypothetical protein